jgi:hypothetical protein
VNPSTHSIAKLHNFDLGTQINEPDIQEHELFLVTLYGKCWCIYISSARQEMTIYKIKENSFIKLRVFNLFSQGRFNLNIVDSLIVLHNNEDKFTMAYDIFAKQDAPVSPPMPITTKAKLFNTNTETDVPLCML